MGGGHRMISLFLGQRTWLHGVPAGLKLVVLAASSVVLFPIQHAGWQAVALSVVLALYMSAGPTALRQLRLMRPLIPLFALIFALQWWSFGWSVGLTLVLRMSTLVLLANLVTLTTRMDDMLAALRPVLLPLQWLGLSPDRLAFAVGLLVRFVPVLLAVLEQLLDTWRARGGNRQVWKLAIPLTIQSIRMADHVAEALAARGGITPSSQNKKSPEMRRQSSPSTPNT